MCQSMSGCRRKRSFSAVRWVEDLEKDKLRRGKRSCSTPDLEQIRLIGSHLGEFVKKNVSSLDRAPRLGMTWCGYRYGQLCLLLGTRLRP